MADQFLDTTGLTRLWTKIKALLDNKVDKIEGRGLSTNDYTTAEQTKLNGIATGAQVNSITGVKGGAENIYRTGEVNLTAENVGAAAASHTHAAGDIDSGTLPIARGGTGATAALDAITALGGPSIAGAGTEIAENTNLNTLVTPGTYYSGSTTRSATLLNAPFTTAGFKLFVIRTYTSARAMQIVTSTTSTLYIRSGSSLSSETPVWSGWARFSAVGHTHNPTEVNSLVDATTYGPSSRVTFTADAAGLPLKSCVANIDAVQSGSGDPSPSNERPITGLTGANIYVSPTSVADAGTTYTVDWTTEAGTVYGGTLDLLTGILTVDRLKESKTWGSLTNSTNIGTTIVRRRFVVSESINSEKRSETISNIASYGGTYETETVHLFIANVAGPKYIYVFCPTGTDSSQEIQVCYPLDQPLTYQLTPQRVTTLAGTNNIWADAGMVTVKYGAFLQALQQEIEVLAKANES